MVGYTLYSKVTVLVDALSAYLFQIMFKDGSSTKVGCIIKKGDDCGK